jgi:peptide/nickel transport system substrate-binding protein/oligopeptide transport system substrate-binding protein
MIDEITAALETVSPATQSPGGGYFGAIKGYDELVAGKAKDLSGVTAPDDKTVVIALTRPDATFLHLMAINFGFVVPKEEVEKYGADFGKHPVGTGAFKFIEWTPGQKLELERFADYHTKGVPYLDKLTFEFGQDPTAACCASRRAEIDIVGDGIPPAQFNEIMNDAATKDLVRRRPASHRLRYAQCEDSAARQRKVRQAINMAINKDRIVRIINNAALWPRLPPAMPGYDTAEKGYLSIGGAKKLLTEAGPDSFDPAYTMNVDPNPRIAQAVSKTWRQSASRPRSSRWRRPKSSPPAARVRACP